ncbi:MAG: hypothetical protein F9K18_08935 [Thermoanaerobaculia bacterium]|nr:MAG: hypothetical protein F9K18_08935 [Thermoanaerobaculia bacterium]
MTSSEDHARHALELEERLRPEALPRLAVFLADYLGEDAVARHVGGAQAAWEYARVAELDELEELFGDWEVLRAATGALSLARVNEVLRTRFATTWQAASSAEIEQVLELFERALRE